jgi:hypothetical protein
LHHNPQKIFMSKEISTEAKKQNMILTESDEERLRRDIYRSDKEKFELFVTMLRRNKFYSRAKVTHK